MKLVFAPDALHAIAERALELKTGARALRSILEGLMLEIMYDLPSMTDIEEVTITAEVVAGGAPPKLKRKAKKDAA